MLTVMPQTGNSNPPGARTVQSPSKNEDSNREATGAVLAKTNSQIHERKKNNPNPCYP
jgi:hypothetical protein